MKCVFTPLSKFAVSLLVEAFCVFMILTVRKTTWTTLHGLRPSGFPFTRGCSLVPTPDSGPTVRLVAENHTALMATNDQYLEAAAVGNVEKLLSLGLRCRR